MTRETKTLESAYILHRRPWSETSLTVSFFTKTEGLINCLAKGARRPKSPLRGALHPFTRVEISYTGASTASLKTLTDVQILNCAPQYKGMALMSALYINELLFKLLPTADMSVGVMFEMYEQTLERFKQDSDHRWALREFEMTLLDQMGFGLDFTHDMHNLKLNPQALYSFDIEEGIVKIAHYAGDNPQEGIPGEVILALGDSRFEEKHLGYARRLLQKALHFHLGHMTSTSHRTLQKLKQE
ncbi:MAG: DNA repair protein RecO [Legionellales bacterium]|nr:DNA repair protein RecO [Legionellales bacterium]|tara:strand:- start:604 stop:1332 length:729 start_codon:yes stop_codon:yes gene_type:complete